MGRILGAVRATIRSVDPEFDQLHIWRDEHIDPTIHLTDELRAKVTQSGILMVVMSPRYLGSAWCKDELEWFRRQVEERRRDQGRVFVVRALPTPESSWPEFLRDERGHALVGFWFHDASGRDGSDTPYGWRGSRADNEAYVRELGRLRTALMKRLRELRTKNEHRIKSTPSSAVTRLGGPSPDLASSLSDLALSKFLSL